MLVIHIKYQFYVLNSEKIKNEIIIFLIRKNYNKDNTLKKYFNFY